MPNAKDMEDMALVREFGRHHSEAAFTELVRRHLNLVYSVAFRLTNNAGDTEDVAQAVFIILARKAVALSERTLVTGWLYETTRFTSARLLRTNARRRRREQIAYMQSSLNETDTAHTWQQLSPHLETAMSQLTEGDRALLLLRFYENKTAAAVASLLGIRENTAHKREERAVAKLRKYFAKCGVSLSCAAIAGAISAHSVQAAPETLANMVSTGAMAAGTAAASSTLTLVKGTLKIMAWTKAKTAVFTLVVASLATYSVIQHQAQERLRDENEVLQKRIDQLSPLTTENESLSNLLAQAKNSEANAKDQLRQALRQRVEAPVLSKLPPANTSPVAKSDRIALPKDSWNKAGFATPEATLKTRGWAVLNGDREQFAQSVYLTDGARKMIEDQVLQMASASKDPDAPRLAQQALNQNWGAEEAILMPLMALNQNNTFTGYNILSQESPSADEAILQVETDMASAPAQTETLRLQRFGNDWKIVIDENTLGQQMKQQ
jgi:RNA polymerase sigma factor (sigma-70 family)